jgi:SH3-like domain-containing protein
MSRWIVLVLFWASVPALAAVSAPTGTPAPEDNKARYVSQRVAEAYLREGPSYQHKILWVYRHRGYPFLVTASFDVWRRVQTPDGVTGWMSATMLSDQRTVLVTGTGRAQIHESADGGKLVGLADPGAIAGLKTCTAGACHIRGGDIDGWIARDRIWGVAQDEIFK